MFFRRVIDTHKRWRMYTALYAVGALTHNIPEYAKRVFAADKFRLVIGEAR